jgi:hypothetical protein
MKRVLLAAVLAVLLSGCAGQIQNPFTGGKFNRDVWRADIAVIKATLENGKEAIQDVKNELCPLVGEAYAITNDPQNKQIATAYLGSASAVDKAVNNANDGLDLLAGACRSADVKDIKGALIAGAQAINDIKRIFGK